MTTVHRYPRTAIYLITVCTIIMILQILETLGAHR